MFLFRMRYLSARPFLIYALVLLVAVMFQGTALAAKPIQKTFETPEAAVEAMIKALRDHNEKELVVIFGPGSETLVSSGDAVDDRERREEFARLCGEKSRLETMGDRKVILHAGNTDWPFPIPIVKTGERWSFDTERGREEILHRRIGENELGTIQTCLAIADAQREYATLDRDGDGRWNMRRSSTVPGARWMACTGRSSRARNRAPSGRLLHRPGARATCRKRNPNLTTATSSGS